ncbi:hypothetical protein PILCRDRAFT_186958 [Piloderma croceum F 1598]|uniref:Carboxypeptidase n=1 Tax=Piloderma croceum (strain F 1598) TaxID=765440 RepID=A0A0C3CLJ4_PILCF|nr:hypothetical protein PILCRDRAFT_186958 [Piloderma croceum F 1598]
MMVSVIFALLAATSTLVNVQAQSGLPSSFPHTYPNQPVGNYSTAWQTYFQVTQELPNVTWTLPRNWAGNIAVGRDGHPNNTLFFWAFEHTNGSLTDENNEEPWGLWLNGGPGSSSMAGLTLENGPIQVTSEYSIVQNNFSWNGLADYIWIDQPVGTGFATADATGYVTDEDQMGHDFFGFLDNLVKVFPGLAKRPLYLTGESYAGTYIPYITKTYFGMEKPPVRLAKIAMGDGTIGSSATFEMLPTLSVIETYPQLIGYDDEIFAYFKQQEHLCGFDLNLTYPQDAHFPPLSIIPPTDRQVNDLLAQRKTPFRQQSFIDKAATRFVKRSDNSTRCPPKESLIGQGDETINGWYGCFLYDEMLDYALNCSFPYNLEPLDGSDFDVYDIPDALSPQAPLDASIFLNDPRTVQAIHAPQKTWFESINYPFGSDPQGEDPSAPPMDFLTDLATNASKHDIGIVIYSGNDDSLVPRRGSEVVIQNTTFGGIQGFTRKPSTAWTDDAGRFAGIVHQERNFTYVVVSGAGHLVPHYQPEAAYTFLREFVLGTNQTGLVKNASGTVSVVGGESPTLAAGVLPGNLEIFYGSGSTESTYIAPTATIAAWSSFIATAAPSGDIVVNIKARSLGHRTAPPIVVVLFISTAIFLILQ